MRPPKLLRSPAGARPLPAWVTRCGSEGGTAALGGAQRWVCSRQRDEAELGTGTPSPTALSPPSSAAMGPGTGSAPPPWPDGGTPAAAAPSHLPGRNLITNYGPFHLLAAGPALPLPFNYPLTGSDSISCRCSREATAGAAQGPPPAGGTGLRPLPLVPAIPTAVPEPAGPRASAWPVRPLVHPSLHPSPHPSVLPSLLVSLPASLCLCIPPSLLSSIPSSLSPPAPCAGCSAPPPHPLHPHSADFSAEAPSPRSPGGEENRSPPLSPTPLARAFLRADTAAA